MAITTLQAFSSDAPEITIEVSNCLEGEAVPAGTCAVSNVKKISATIVFDRNSNESLPPFSEISLNPEPAESPNHFIVVTISDSATGTALPVDTIAYEKASENDKEVLKIQIEVLEEPNIRQQKIQSFVNQVKADQEAIPGGESQDLVNEMTAKNAEIVSAMESLYSENRLGSYNITVKYHSTQGSWIGETMSSPIAIEVINKGSFFDSLQAP